MEMHLYRQAIKGREKMLEALEKGDRSWTGMACVNVIFDGKTHLSTNQACHAGLSGANAGSFAVVSGLMKPSRNILEEEEALYFLEWLLNESPYSSTFITKSAEEALYYKATISSSHHPSNLMAAGMVASRRLWEYPEVARFFVDMAKAGVKKDLAFFSAHMLSCDFKREGKASWTAEDRGHVSMCPGIMGGEGLLNFLKHNVTAPNLTYHKSSHYHGYDRMYGQGGEHLQTYLQADFPFNGEVKKVAGFFPADKVEVRSCSYENIIQGMVEFQHTLLKHIGFEENN
ncbi:hypothetical protein D3C77_248690 [compost metagenome]